MNLQIIMTIYQSQIVDSTKSKGTKAFEHLSYFKWLQTV